MLVTGLLMACSSTASPTPQPTTQVAIPLVSGGTEATLPAEAKSPARVRIFGDLKDKATEIYHLLHTPDTKIWVYVPTPGHCPMFFT